MNETVNSNRMGESRIVDMQDYKEHFMVFFFFFLHEHIFSAPPWNYVGDATLMICQKMILGIKSHFSRND